VSELAAVEAGLKTMITEGDTAFSGEDDVPILSASTGEDTVIEDPDWTPPASTLVRLTVAPVPDTAPTAPLDLQNVVETTDADSIGLTWSVPSSDGGSAVLNYLVFFKLETDTDYVELASDVVETSYTTTADLTDGENYMFKVQARNAVGNSVDSNEVTIRAAKIPD
jgi:hypothetical protein